MGDDNSDCDSRRVKYLSLELLFVGSDILMLDQIFHGGNCCLLVNSKI